MFSSYWVYFCFVFQGDSYFFGEKREWTRWWKVGKVNSMIKVHVWKKLNKKLVIKLVFLWEKIRIQTSQGKCKLRIHSDQNNTLSFEPTITICEKTLFLFKPPSLWRLLTLFPMSWLAWSLLCKVGWLQTYNLPTLLPRAGVTSVCL